MDTQLQGRADLHMHTTASDGFYCVEDVLDHIAEQAQLNVIAITDHDVMEASLWAYEHRHLYPFDIVPGVEVSSEGGHILALWVTKPIPAKMSLEETVAAIHEQNGIAIIAHPFEMLVSVDAMKRYLRHPQALKDSGLDAIEVHNAGTPTPGNNWMARRTAAKLGMTMVGNSDAHSIGSIGCGVTRFAGSTAAELREAILNGQTVAEGVSWPISDYLRILPISTKRKAACFAASHRPRMMRFGRS